MSERNTTDEGYLNGAYGRLRPLAGCATYGDGDVWYDRILNFAQEPSAPIRESSGDGFGGILDLLTGGPSWTRVSEDSGISEAERLLDCLNPLRG